jgi:hypothetical protein
MTNLRFLVKVRTSLILSSDMGQCLSCSDVPKTGSLKNRCIVKPLTLYAAKPVGAKTATTQPSGFKGS